MTHLKTLVHALVSNRLDYCNSVMCGASVAVIRKMQMVLNASARLITGNSRYDHITPALRQLHWLPIKQRIQYKVALLVYKCLHNCSPDYLSDFCVPVSSLPWHRALRSADHGDIVQPRLRTHFGARSFRVSAPAIWNSLPPSVRDHSLTLDCFKNALKTHLFNIAYMH